MKTYERPLAKEIKLDLCDVILTSAPEAPNLGDVAGGTAEWLGSFWN
ncbi:MAG: hypothetical protein IJS44_05470 [Clostridia bacterium]|nr:hypothetical protein [Clostridia bacterium]